MKYVSEIEIRRPLYKVIELFEDTGNLTSWVSGLKSFEHLSGTAGEPGAKSKLTFMVNEKPLVMTETIIKRSLPVVFVGSYETKGVTNLISNSFIKVGPGTTRYITQTEFRFNGVMRFLAPFMKGLFRRQTQKRLQGFKDFAERS